MIIVKRKNLFILALLVTVLLVLGEMRFFFAIKGANLTQDMQVKYEIESFIFASIVFTIVIFLFLVYFMHKSHNILKLLDKMIELSEYGEHDISSHMKQLGSLGEKINYLLYHTKHINDMKSLKISSLSNITNILIEKNRSPVFLLNRRGDVVDCSREFLSKLGIDKGKALKKNVSDLFSAIDYEDLFPELEKNRKASVETSGIKFYPVINVKGDISHVIGVLEKNA